MLLSGSTPFTGFFRRPRQRSRLQVFGNQLCVLAQPIALALDLHDDGVVQQAIQQCAGDHDIAEDLAPLAEAAVTGQDERAAVISFSPCPFYYLARPKLEIMCAGQAC